ncbi:TPA: ead/Ea22-like family protein [Enterobacter roggenkampii]|nr:ead/Ea22-like family protein [Enterobacter roggenkampii]
MSNIDKRALREAAANAKIAGEAPVMPFDQRITALNDFMKQCAPATVLALLDELEAKDKSISFLKDQLAQLANFNPDWDKLEAATDSLREHMAELTAARKRIAELEARDVLLPPKAPDNLASCLDGYEKWLIATTFRDTWNACLAEVVRVNAAAGKGE